jgi:hypothetical protein
VKKTPLHDGEASRDGLIAIPGVVAAATGR